MPEILTESFCERCGTRYTFESAAPTKAHKLGKFKTISKGLKNYVMSDDTSLDEAMAAARSDDELEQTAQQLDAFHSTFNFCMNCRQYTCGNCWNEAESRCLTCAPHLGQEILPAPFPDVAAAAPISLEAWPEADIKPAAAAAFAEAVANAETEEVPEIDAAGRLDRLSGTTDDDVVPQWLAQAEAEALAQAEARAALEAEEEAYVTAELPFEDEAAAPVDAPDLAAAAIATPVEPETALAAPEPEFDIVPAAAVAEPIIEVAPEPVVEIVPEPVAAESPRVDAAAVAAAGLVAAAAASDEPEVAAPPVERAAPTEVDGQAAAATQQTSALFAKFRPGQNIDAELAAYEAALVAQAADAVADEPETAAAELEEAAPVEVQPEAIEAAPVLAEPVAEAPPEPVVAVEQPAVEPETIAAAAELVAPEPDLAAPVVLSVIDEAQPEAVAAELEAAQVAEPEPVPAPEPQPVAAEAAPEPTPEQARTDVVEQPTWRIVAPDAPTNGHAPEELPAAASAVPPAPPAAPPEWPTAPQWPQPNLSHLAEQRPASQSAAMDALWAASVRDVVAPAQGGPAGTVQPCNSCGLSLSANARFCRRCGTRQGG